MVDSKNLKICDDKIQQSPLSTITIVITGFSFEILIFNLFCFPDSTFFLHLYFSNSQNSLDYHTILYSDIQVYIQNINEFQKNYIKV